MTLVQINSRHTINIDNVAYVQKGTNTLYKGGDETNENGYYVVFNARDADEALVIWLSDTDEGVENFIAYLEAHSYICA